MLFSFPSLKFIRNKVLGAHVSVCSQSQCIASPRSSSAYLVWLFHNSVRIEIYSASVSSPDSMFDCPNFSKVRSFDRCCKRPPQFVQMVNSIWATCAHSGHLKSVTQCRFATNEFHTIDYDNSVWFRWSSPLLSLSSYVTRTRATWLSV